MQCFSEEILEMSAPLNSPLVHNVMFMIALQIQRQEDDTRARLSTASDQYRKAVTDTQAMRQEYFNFQLPRILRVRTRFLSGRSEIDGWSQSLKECADEIDLGTQYHLTRYAFLFESIVLSDGSTLIPPHEEGKSKNGLSVKQI